MIRIRARFSPVFRSAWIRHALSTAAVVSALVTGTPAHARDYDAREISNSEVAILPDWCRNTMTFARTHGSQATFEDMVRTHGDGWRAMHHYCWALVKEVRASSQTDRQKRQNYLKAALSDLDFVVNHLERTPQGAQFPFAPLVYFKRGQLGLAMGRQQQAVNDFRFTIGIKPDYAPAYHQLAEMLMKRGMKKEAREVLDDGLKHAPDSKILKSLDAEFKR